MENLHISAGTVARTLVLILAIINQILSACGKSPLPIESETLEQLVTAGFTTIAALIAWWKNNSFTTNALKADALLAQLNGKH
jgi:SPP1 family holin|nr:MAG TPA: holin [Caudoviricetes sp.]